MDCHDKFPSGHGEKHPDPKSGRDLDQDKPGYTTSCWGGETSPDYLCAFFSGFSFLIPDSANQP